MSTLKRRQHYVWRNYLRAWAERDKVWTYLKEQNKVERTDLMNVTQERDFYKLVSITEFEEKFLKEHISRSHPTVQGLQSDFLLMFTIHMKLRKEFESNPSLEVEEQIKKIEINAMENAHSLMETSGQKLVACRSFEDLKFLNDAHCKNETIMYLCLQYFRTKNMKEKIKAKMKSIPNFSAENIWNIMSFLMSTNVAMNVALDPKLRFLFIDNSTEEKFVTCDQPVINILASELDENGNVAGVEFFYPLSPEHALVIDFKNDNNDRFQNIIAQKSVVNWFNSKLTGCSDRFVFASSKEQIEKLIGSIRN